MLATAVLTARLGPLDLSRSSNFMWSWRQAVCYANRLSSRTRATARTTVSANGAPMIWKPIRRTDEVNPHGTERAGRHRTATYYASAVANTS